jgi:hypothetical protein
MMLFLNTPALHLSYTMVAVDIAQIVESVNDRYAISERAHPFLWQSAESASTSNSSHRLRRNK